MLLLRLFVVGLAVVAVASSCGESRDRSGGGLTSRQAQASSSPSGKSQRATIVRDVDGDTIKVKLASGEVTSVRLIGIDTPETHKPGVKVECGGPEASANAAKLAPAGAEVVLTPDPTQDYRDKYGRLLAYASVGGHSLQLAQLRAGWAEVYVFKHDFQRVGSFRRASAVAKKHGRGVWGQCGGDFHSNQPAN